MGLNPGSPYSKSDAQLLVLNINFCQERRPGSACLQMQRVSSAELRKLLMAEPSVLEEQGQWARSSSQFGRTNLLH